MWKHASRLSHRWLLTTSCPEHAAHCQTGFLQNFTFSLDLLIIAVFSEHLQCHVTKRSVFLASIREKYVASIRIPYCASAIQHSAVMFLLPHFHEEMLRSWLSCNRTPGRPALDTAPPPGPVRDCTTFVACLAPFHKNMPVEIFTWLRSLLLFLQQCILWFLRRPLPVQTCSHYWTS